MNKRITSLLAAAAFATALASSASAQIVHLDTFSGNTDTNLATSTFVTGATTGFNFWANGTPGDMAAGFFSVGSRADLVHSQFSSSADADGNVEGDYAYYNGFQDADGDAYVIRLTSLIVGQQYDLSAMMLTLAPNPPYPQVSNIRFLHNSVALGTDLTLVPAPSGSEVWAQYVRTFVATGDDTLVIRNLGGASNAGNDFALDNITVSVVPTPAAAAAFGLAGLMVARRRRA